MERNIGDKASDDIRLLLNDVDALLTWRKELPTDLRERLTGLANALELAMVQAKRVRVGYSCPPIIMA